jgi:hypothetical protein
MPSVYVVAAAAIDPVALGLVAELPALVGGEVRHLTPEDLARARSWTQEIDPAGRTTSRLVLADGLVLASTTVAALYNRLTLPPAPSERVAEDDRAYGTAELQACTVSWLGTLGGRVVNPPDPGALGGDRRSPLEWAVLAAQVGLPVAGPVAGGRLHALVIGEEVVGALPAHRLAAGLRALRAAAGADVLGVDLVDAGEGWAVSTVSPLPDLRRGGRRAVEALAALLRGRASVERAA